MREVQRLQRYRLLLSWLGTSYHGWISHTPEMPSVQNTLQRVVLGFLEGNKGASHCKHAPDVLHMCSRVHGCSRTDAGVHAIGAVAHLDLPVLEDRPYSSTAVMEGLNFRLRGSKEAIQVLDASAVDSSFNARNTVRKRYVYSCAFDSLKGGVLFDRHLVLHMAHPLNVFAMQEASRAFLGTHDFSSFRASGCTNPSPVRDVSVCEVTTVPPPQINSNASQLEGVQYFDVAVEGKGFLYRQVRKMVGALLAVGRGQWSTKDIIAAFEKKDPSACPFVAPPHGLTLASVHYATDEGAGIQCGDSAALTEGRF